MPKSKNRDIETIKIDGVGVRGYASLVEWLSPTPVKLCGEEHLRVGYGYKIHIESTEDLWMHDGTEWGYQTQGQAMSSLLEVVSKIADNYNCDLISSTGEYMDKHYVFNNMDVQTDVKDVKEKDDDGQDTGNSGQGEATGGRGDSARGLGATEATA